MVNPRQVIAAANKPVRQNGWPNNIQIATEDGAVLQHSRPDGAFQMKWRIDDVNCESELSSPPLRMTAVGAWKCLEREGDQTKWMVPRQDLRFSAGVPLKTIKPRAVISTHLGDILLLEIKSRTQFVVLCSFSNGLRAVQRQFERELKEGRRACTTSKERVANLRKCRKAMNAYSDRVVRQHMEVLPFKWKGASKRAVGAMTFHAVLLLTTPKGCLVDCGHKTSVAVLGDDWHLLVSFVGHKTVEARWENTPGCSKRRVSLSSYEESQMMAFDQVGDDVNMIRYLRDPKLRTDSLQFSKIFHRPRFKMLSIEDGGEATGRWLVFAKWDCVALKDAMTGKMAFLRTPSLASGAMETSEGLWLWGICPSNGDWWSKLFEVPPEIYEAETAVKCRVLDEELEAKAFCESGIYRNEDRHPGHYWVVAGYGPVPASLRAPDHIYKQVETVQQLKGYGRMCYWSGSDSSWSVVELDWVAASSVWGGAVDLRHDVTVESIKEDPKTDIWRPSVSIMDVREAKHSGEFSVSGNTLSAWSSAISLKVPVTAGRWLWRLKTMHREAELTLWHESVSKLDISNCTNQVRPLDMARLQFRQDQLSALAPVIREESLRAKIAEFAESVYTPETTFSVKWLMLLDKDVRRDEKEWYALKFDSQAQLIPLRSGLALVFGSRCATFFLAKNVIRISLKFAKPSASNGDVRR